MRGVASREMARLQDLMDEAGARTPEDAPSLNLEDFKVMLLFLSCKGVREKTRGGEGGARQSGPGAGWRTGRGGGSRDAADGSLGLDEAEGRKRGVWPRLWHIAYYSCP